LNTIGEKIDQLLQNLL